MLRLSLTLTLSFVFTFLFAQKEEPAAYIGFEWGFTHDYYDLVYAGIDFPNTVNEYSVLSGLVVGYELARWLDIESGVLSKSYYGGVRFGREIDHTFQVPLRAKGKFFLIQDRLSVNASAGFRLHIPNPYFPLVIEKNGSLTDMPNGYQSQVGDYEYVSTGTSGKKMLGEVGASIEYATKFGLRIALITNYTKGWSELQWVTGGYHGEESGIQEFLKVGKGESFNWGIRVAYEINRVL